MSVSSTHQPIQGRLSGARDLNRIWYLVIPVIAVLLLLYLALLFKMSSLNKTNSDYVSTFLEANEIMQGNVLLNGWTVPSDNFYLSDIPFLLTTIFLFGRTPLAIYAAPFLIYTILLAASAGIIFLELRDRRARWIGLGTLLFYLGTPSLNSAAPVSIGHFLFGGADHMAVLAFCLLGWLALGAALQARTRRSALRAAALYAAAALVVLMSDPLGNVVFLLPTLTGLLLALLGSRRQLIHAALIGLTLLVFGAAHLGLFTIHAAGGFTIQRSESYAFVSADGLGSNATAVFFGLLSFSDGYIFGQPLRHLSTIVSMIRVAGLGLMLVMAMAALRRGLRNSEGWDLRFVLALAVLVNIASCLTSEIFAVSLPPSDLTGGGAARFLIPALLFGGVLVALELPARLDEVMPSSRRWMIVGLWGGAVLVAAGLFAAQGLKRWHEEPSAATDPARAVGRWLLDHDLTYGAGGYWEGPLITALSGLELSVHPVRVVKGKLVPQVWLANQHWYQDKPRPQFVVYEPANTVGVTPETIANTYGQPSAIEHLAGYDIALLGAAD